MSYIQELIDSNLKSLTEMLKTSIAAAVISVDDIRDALVAETVMIPAGEDIYNVTQVSTNLLAKISTSPDRDMIIIVKKILRSTKYAATTFYAISGQDNNPHHLPVKRLQIMAQS